MRWSWGISEALQEALPRARDGFCSSRGSAKWRFYRSRGDKKNKQTNKEKRRGSFKVPGVRKCLLIRTCSCACVSVPYVAAVTSEDLQDTGLCNPGRPVWPPQAVLAVAERKPR